MNDNEIKKALQSEEIPEKISPENMKLMLDSLNEQKPKKNITMKKRVTRIVSLAAAFAVIVGGSSIYLSTKNREKCNDIFVETDSEEPSAIKTASDYSDVYSYFTVKNLLNDWFGGFTTKSYTDEIMVDEEVAFEESVMEDSANVDYEQGFGNTDTNSALGSGGDAETEYYDTYNQESDILEADIVKTDGKHIYYANYERVNVAEVSDGNFINTYSLDIAYDMGVESVWIEDMYIYNGTLVVISGGGYNGYQGRETLVSFYSADNMSFLGSYTQSGAYSDVRLTSDGYLYLVTGTDMYYDIEKDYLATYIPEYCVNSERQFVEPECIVIPSIDFEADSGIHYINVSGLDLNSDSKNIPVDMKSVAGNSGQVYCTADTLYVAAVSSGYNESEIMRFSIESGVITPQNSAKVQGWVNDQFSMSEYNGYFRIATTYTDEQYNSNNALYVLDSDMNTIGYISDFGIDETIKSVNFNGDMAYIVTFRQTDPLYSIDLSDPANPVILDEYKITGYSSYMQSWSDGLLLGFGESGDEQGNLNGVKLTMFDNSDPSNLKEVSTVEVTYDYLSDFYIDSPAVWDRKALLISPEKNLIGIPITRYQFDDMNNTILSGYMFYSFENNELVYKGEVLGMEYNDYYNLSYDISFEPINRALYIGDYIYVMSGNEFISANMYTFEMVSNIIFVK